MFYYGFVGRRFARGGLDFSVYQVGYLGYDGSIGLGYGFGVCTLFGVWFGQYLLIPMLCLDLHLEDEDWWLWSIAVWIR